MPSPAPSESASTQPTPTSSPPLTYRSREECKSGLAIESADYQSRPELIQNHLALLALLPSESKLGVPLFHRSEEDCVVLTP